MAMDDEKKIAELKSLLMRRVMYFITDASPPWKKARNDSQLS